MKTEMEKNVQAQRNIIFIFSLPRSGSTLLQRLLSAHSKIKTYAEPYLLLPLAELDNLSDQYWFYGKRCNTGVLDLIEGIPGGRRNFNRKLNEFIKSIYFSFLEKDEKYFLDKTPHNYYIVRKIGNIFPEAKFIFIFRNPLAVYSSFKQSFYRGHNITNNYLLNDLYKGPAELMEGYTLLKEKSIKVVFRDLLTDPGRELKKIMEYLELEYEPDMLKEFKNVTFKGHVNWDNASNFKIKSITPIPVSKWKKYTDSWFKKSIFRKYLTSIDEKYILESGNSLDGLLKELRSIKTAKPGVLHFLDYCIAYLFRNFFKQESRLKLQRYFAHIFYGLHLYKMAEYLDTYGNL